MLVMPAPGRQQWQEGGTFETSLGPCSKTFLEVGVFQDRVSKPGSGGGHL